MNTDEPPRCRLRRGGSVPLWRGWTKPKASYLLCLPSNHLLMQCTITPVMTDISKVTKWLMSTPPFCTNLGAVTKMF